MFMPKASINLLTPCGTENIIPEITATLKIEIM